MKYGFALLIEFLLIQDSLVSEFGLGKVPFQELFTTPPVAQPHWVLHPTYQVARFLEKDPNTYELANKFYAKSVALSLRWWDKYGQYEDFVHEEQNIPPELFHGVVRKPQSTTEEAETEEITLRHEDEDERYEGQRFRPCRFRGPQSWLCRPSYYLFNRDTNELLMPLRPESRELVSALDVHKKLWKCAEKGQLRLAMACLRAGADVNLRDYTTPYNHTAVLWAAWGGHACTLSALVRDGRGDLETRDWEESTAMHIAARRGHIEVCECLFNLSDGNIYDRDGLDRTVLHVASLEGHSKVVRRLLQLGCEVNAVDYRKETALHLCAYRGSVTTAKVLVEWGADLHGQNFKGKTAIDIAERLLHKDLYYYLEGIVGTKCVYDRLPDSIYKCGRRHRDEPGELFHRPDHSYLCNYTVPEVHPWDLEEGVEKGDAKSIYEDPSKWENSLKQSVDLFPNQGEWEAGETPWPGTGTRSKGERREQAQGGTADESECKASSEDSSWDRELEQEADTALQRLSARTKGEKQADASFKPAGRVVPADQESGADDGISESEYEPILSTEESEEPDRLIESRTPEAEKVLDQRLNRFQAPASLTTPVAGVSRNEEVRSPCTQCGRPANPRPKSRLYAHKANIVSLAQDESGHFMFPYEV